MKKANESSLKKDRAPKVNASKISQNNSSHSENGDKEKKTPKPTGLIKESFKKIVDKF